MPANMGFLVLADQKLPARGPHNGIYSYTADGHLRAIDKQYFSVQILLNVFCYS